MGPDGHTASWPPGDPVIRQHASPSTSAGAYQGRVRMTLTPPVVDAARGARRPHHGRRQGRRRGRGGSRAPAAGLPIARVPRRRHDRRARPGRRRLTSRTAGAGRRVKLDVGCSMSLRALWATPAVLMLRPRSGEGQWVIAERYQIEPPAPISEFTDAHGNLCQRIVVPEGSMTISVEATVDTADEIDVDATAPRVADRRGARLGAAVPPAEPLLPVRPRVHQRRRDHQRRAARLPAGRGDPVVDRARGALRVRHQLGRDVGGRHALQPRRRVPRLRPPRHRPVPQPRHPGAHGRRLPPRPRPDGPARLVRGLRRRALVHVRRHAARAARQPGDDRLRPRRRRRRVRHAVRPGRAGADVRVRARGDRTLPTGRHRPVRRTPNVRPDGRTSRHRDHAGLGRPARRAPPAAPARAVRRRPGPGRSATSLDVGDLRIDYTKQRIDDAVLAALQAVAAAAGVAGASRRDVRRRADQRHRGPRRAARRAAGAGRRGHRGRRPRRRPRRPRGARADGRLRRPGPRRDVDGRHRASASAPSSTSASAAPTSVRRWRRGPSTPTATPSSTARFVSNVDGADIAAAHRRARPRRDAVRRVVEDVHDRSRR